MIEYINLPYSADALEPIISARTIEFHYGKHLKAYVDNLNKLIIGTEFENMTLEEIVKSSTGAVFNNAGQVLNHNLYFTQFKKTVDDAEQNVPIGKLAEQINKQWGSFEVFREEFQNKGVSLIGSGWVWLSADKDGNLEISQEGAAGNPITRGRTPILTFDAWEHAYYLDYQNRRVDHLKALWIIVDWEIIERRYYFSYGFSLSSIQ